MRVLGIGAHPDDLEIHCGGTLAKYAAQGHEVVMAHLTNGDLGSYVHAREELGELRIAEARSAAGVAGAEHCCVGLSDGEVDSSSREQQALVADVVRGSRPDVVLTHSPDDYHADHVQTSKLVFAATFLATVPLFETAVEHHPTVTPLYYMDTVAGIDFQPTDYVDVSAHFETKVRMLSEHATQLEWLGDHDGMDPLEQIRTVGRFRGLQCNVAYAEAFHAVNTWPRAVTTRLLP